jgi:hypothetical protein
MKTSFYLPVISLAILLVSGCAKDTGVGPRGPQGPQGPAGNANVVGTNSVTVNWTYDSGMNAYTSQINAGDITQDIVNIGSVQVFIQYGTEWWVLPDIIGVNSTTFGYGVGYVSLINSNSDDSTPAYPTHSTFRVVIISANARIENPDVNWQNYREVKEALHLAN